MIRSKFLVTRLLGVLIAASAGYFASLPLAGNAEAVSWTQCASEWQSCSVPGAEPAMVRYGQNGNFHHIDDVTGSIACNNNTFGDPAPGTPKQCWYSFNTLPDHPQKSDSVMFLGDETDGRLNPGELIERGIPGINSGHAFLEYQTDGNLVFYSKSSVEPNYTVEFASSTNNFCAGYAEVDPYYGLAVYDCTGVRRWTLYSSPVSDHTNFHFSIEFGELRLFDMDNQAIIWNAKNNGLNGTFYNPGLSISYTWVKNIWLDQGWDHVQSWNEATVDEFTAQFSSNPTDSHADAHRMMQSIDDHKEYIWSGEDANFGPVYWYNLTRNWQNDFDCNPDLGTCVSERDNHLVEQAHEAILVMNQYLTVIKSIIDEVTTGDFSSDPLADLVFEQVFTSVDYESAVNAYNWLFDYNTEYSDDLNRMLLYRDAAIYNNKWTRLLARNPYRTDRMEAELNLNLAQAWNVLNGNLTFPDGSNIVSAVQSLNMKYLLSLPKYDEKNQTYTYSHTLRFGLYDGVFADGTVIANQSMNSLIPLTATAALSGDVGLFGNNDYTWKVTKTLDGETDVNTSYSNTLGFAISGYLTPANAWAQWRGDSANGRFQRPDWVNVANQQSEISNLGIEAIYDTELAGQVADGTWSSTGVAEHPPGSFMHNIEQIINSYDSLTADETAFVNRLLEYDSTGNVTEQGFQVTTMQTVNQYVTMNPDNTITYNGRGPVTSFTLSPSLYAVVQEGWNNGETSLEVMASVLNTANPSVDEDAAKSFLHHIAYGVQAYSKSQLSMAGGAAFSTTIKLDGLTEGQKQGVIVAPLLATLGGYTFTTPALAAITGWYSAALPSQWRNAISVAGAQLGGYTAASIAAGALGEKQAKIEVGGFGSATLALGRWDIPQNVLNSSASGTPFFGSMITTDFGVRLNVGAFKAKPLWGDTSRRLTNRVIDHTWKNVPLDGYSHPSKSPVLLARMQERNGSDTAALRIDNLNNESFDVIAEEEASAEIELTHADEIIGYMTFNEGPITNMHGNVIGEAGNLAMDQNTFSSFQTINFDNAYTEPVVVASVVTYNGAQPVHVTIDSVTSTSVRIQLEEWDYLDGGHITETVSYVVLEKGVHKVDSGELLAVGSVTADSNVSTWDIGVYGVNFDSDSKPVVVTQAQSDESHALVTRLSEVTNSYFKTQLQVEESKRASVGGSVQADVGFIALGEHSYPQEYCVVNGGNTNYEWIESVGLNGTRITTGNNSGYSLTSGSALDFVLNRGGSNTINLTPGFFSNSYPEGWSLWIDYNQNGQFEGSEQAGTASPSSTAQTVTATVPVTANLGATRMRVAMEYNGITPDACAAMIYGEYEDFAVTIQ